MAVVLLVAKNTLEVESPMVDLMGEAILVEVAVGKLAILLSFHDFMLLY